MQVHLKHLRLGRPAQSQNNSRLLWQRQFLMKIMETTSILRPEAAHQSTRNVMKSVLVMIKDFEFASKF